MSIVITSTDTPETDRAASRDYSPLSVPYDFARNLERQRNAALSIIEESIDALDGEINIDWRNESRELLRKLGEHLESVSNKARLRQERDDALKRLDSSERARKSLSEACDYLQAKQDATERLVRELRDALFGLTEDCLLPGFRKDWDTYTEAQAAIIKAKEALK